MWEWRDGQLMDDSELERLWQMSEMQKAEVRPGIRSDANDVLKGFWLAIVCGWACWGLIYLACKWMPTIWRWFR